MNTYHVTYYYLADFGYVTAKTSQEAINTVGFKRSPFEKNECYRNWGLQASLVYADTSKIKDI